LNDRRGSPELRIGPRTSGIRTVSHHIEQPGAAPRANARVPPRAPLSRAEGAPLGNAENAAPLEELGLASQRVGSTGKTAATQARPRATSRPEPLRAAAGARPWRFPEARWETVCNDPRSREIA